MSYRLNRGESILSKEDIAAIEAKDDPTGIRNAKYVGDLCTQLSGGQWRNDQMAVFYQPDVSKVVTQNGGKASNYFSIYRGFDSCTYICDGITAVKNPIAAIMYLDGEIVFSRYRWDFRHGIGKYNTTAIDGGRDYTKIVEDGPYESVDLYIKKGNWYVHLNPTKLRRKKLIRITNFIP